MKEQTLKNHARYVVGYHVIFFAATIAILVLSLIYLVRSLNHGVNILPAVIIFLMAVAFVHIFIFLRGFPLAVQDRAIRAEENLRHFAMTGKLLHKDLTLKQIIALRFAADEEFVALAERTLKEKLDNSQIKQAIKNRRADHHRA